MLNHFQVKQETLKRGEMSTTFLCSRGHSKRSARKIIQRLREKGELEFLRYDGKVPIYQATAKIREYRTFGKVMNMSQFQRRKDLFSEIVTITRYSKPEAVLIPYEQYLEMIK